MCKGTRVLFESVLLLGRYKWLGKARVKAAFTLQIIDLSVGGGEP